ncbi:MAG: hypothetical protein IJU45_06005 [Clostridia bacterium]|nr:hypothetical protein [Clostridia bacterium]
MKKVLAAVLSLILVLSFTSVAFAADIVPGKVFFGIMEDVNANPGDTVTLDVSLVADVNESDGFDADGTLVLPVWLMAGSDLLEFVDFQLSDDAIAAGATMDEDPSFFWVEPAQVGAEIRIPATYLFNTDMVVAQVTVKVSEDWPIVDYEAEDLTVIVADSGYGNMDPYVDSETEGYQYLENELVYNTVSGNITYKYQAPAKDRLIEKLKEIGRTIVELLQAALAFLSKTLEPAVWWNK